MTSPSEKREPPLIVPPKTPAPTSPATLIFIHGYNERASLFNSNPPNQRSLAHSIHAVPALRHVKIIIPEALPCIHPSVKGHAWYNISTPFPAPGNPATFEEHLDTTDARDWGSNEDDMAVTMDYLEELIRDEVAGGTPLDRIVLMGYSQGGGIVTLFLLTRELASGLGAVVSHAGFAPTSIKSIYRMQRENGLEGEWSNNTKFFMLHGDGDVFVPRGIFEIWRSRLEGFKERGNGIAEMEWRVVDKTRHAISVRVWTHVIEILQKVVPEGRNRSGQKL